MSRLLNCFGRIETEVDTSGYSLLDTLVAGEYQVEMGPGIYRIVLIGGGGGGGKMRWAAGHEAFYRYAQGGVGATLDFYFELTQATTATVTVGSGGHSDSRGDADTTATGGTDSSITGIPGLVVSCGAGTAGNIVSRTPTAGTMGTAVLTGATIIRVDMNSNEHPIVSTTTSGIRANINWPTQSILGRGGGCSAGQGVYIYEGGAAYCYIQYFNKNYFHPEDIL